MHHLVYKIVNQENGMYYYGVHSTLNIEDGYMGSGTLLRRDIKKHGVESFEREIVYTFKSRQEALDMEESIVTLEMLKDGNCYNLIVGGNKGIRTVSSKREFFSKAARPVKIVAVEKYNPEYKILFTPKIVYRLVNAEKHDVFTQTIYKILLSPKILEAITDVCNNKITHHLTDKYLKVIYQLPFWDGNVNIQKVQW